MENYFLGKPLKEEKLSKHVLSIMFNHVLEQNLCFILQYIGRYQRDPSLTHRQAVYCVMKPKGLNVLIQHLPLQPIF